MAVAMAHSGPSALPGRTWEEEVVPALRKRLENESYVLMKRMSGHSLVSSDDGQTASGSIPWRPIRQTKASEAPPNLLSYQLSNGSSSGGETRSSHVGRPSAIPRPSLNYYQNGASTSTAYLVDGSEAGSTTAPNTPSHRKSNQNRARARTISTPQPFSHENPPSNFRPPKSRIPRPPPLTYYSSPNGINGISAVDQPMDSPYDFPDISTQPDLLREQHPVQSGEATPRESMEEEYEHWYRGDISRSGGVGELKIGKRKEMLDIANYGHYPTPVFDSRASSTLDVSYAERGTRKRAGSLSERESVYIEDESIGMAVTEYVIDEMPLTDGEWSGAEGDQRSTESGSRYGHTNGSRKYLATQARTKPSTQLNSATNPNPSRKPIQPAPVVIPSRPIGGQPRSASTPVVRTPKSSNGPNPASRAPIQVPYTSLNKRAREKSPAPASTANKKAKAGGKIQLNGVQLEKDERPLSTSLVDAIPSWSVPVPKDGNWDEVVLPVIAKQRGLEGYREVGGSPSGASASIQKPPMRTEIEPAPGTFGFDHSKYRPPLADGERMIPMSEFGARHQPSPIPSVHTPSPDARASPSLRTESPAPFSRYQPRAAPIATMGDQLSVKSMGKPGTPITMVQPSPLSQQQHIRVIQEEEEKGGGCCKCVIM